MKHHITITVNGQEHRLAVESHRTLLQVLRDELGLTGTKDGCGEGDCGACTVLLDGQPVNSCLVLAPQADGHRIVTVEGLSLDGPHPLQRAFVEEGAVQCGFCTPGLLMAAKALLDRNPHPSEEEIKRALSGNLCRCTGYVKVIKAVLKAASGG